MRRIAAADALLMVLLSGCGGRDSSHDAFRVLVYEELTNGQPSGTLTWTLTDAHQTVFDSGGSLHPSLVLHGQLVSPGPPLGVSNVTIWLDEQTLQDVLIGEGCQEFASNSCSRGKLTWPEQGASLAWMGSSLIPHVSYGDDATAKLAIQGHTYNFHAEHEGKDQVRLTPIVQTRSHGAACNLLDDETLIDLSLRVVTECIVRDAATRSYRLVSTPAALPIGREGPMDLGPLLQPLPRHGPLPAGADWTPQPGDLSLAEAYQVALDKSQGLGQFLQSHPEAALEHGAPASAGSASTGGVYSTESFRYRFQLVSSGSTGYEVEVSRNTTTLAGVPPQTTYVLTTDHAWTPPEEHRWATMQPAPDGLASIREWATVLPKISGALSVDSIDPRNTASRGDPGPVLNYFATLNNDDCPPRPRPSCVSTEYVRLDATSGLLVEARLAGPRLDAFFSN